MKNFPKNIRYYINSLGVMLMAFVLPVTALAQNYYIKLGYVDNGYQANGIFTTKSTGLFNISTGEYIFPGNKNEIFDCSKILIFIGPRCTDRNSFYSGRVNYLSTAISWPITLGASLALLHVNMEKSQDEDMAKQALADYFEKVKVDPKELTLRISKFRKTVTKQIQNNTNEYNSYVAKKKLEKLALKNKLKSKLRVSYVDEGGYLENYKNIANFVDIELINDRNIDGGIEINENELVDNSLKKLNSDNLKNYASFFNSEEKAIKGMILDQLRGATSLAQSKNGIEVKLKCNVPPSLKKHDIGVICPSDAISLTQFEDNGATVKYINRGIHGAIGYSSYDAENKYVSVKVKGGKVTVTNNTDEYIKIHSVSFYYKSEIRTFNNRNISLPPQSISSEYFSIQDEFREDRLLRRKDLKGRSQNIGIALKYTIGGVGNQKTLFSQKELPLDHFVL